METTIKSTTITEAIGTKWTIDPSHSDVLFKVKHLMITNVTGKFSDYTSELEMDEQDFTNSKIKFTAKTSSISTGTEQRDAHLKSPDFFDAEKFPELKFESVAITKTGENNYVVEGNLTIKDVTKSIKLNAEFGGTMINFYGNTKAGFEVTGAIKRKEFGLTWDAVTEAGGIAVSDEIKIQCNVQFAKQK